MVLSYSDRTWDTQAGLMPLPPIDLPSDEPPLETYLHLQQMLLLLKCLDWHWQGRTDYFAAGNLTVYYSMRQRKSEDFMQKHSDPSLEGRSEEAVQSIFGPDFFVVLDTEKRPRKSWTTWEEDGKYPNVIVELLSDSTAEVDRGLKKQLYQDTFRTPEYFWFSPDTLEFEGHVLVRGTYEPILANVSGQLWSEELGLFLGILDKALRFWDETGHLVPTPEEAAQEAQRQRDVMAAKLRELGVNPDELQ